MKDHGPLGDKPAAKSANVPANALDCAAVELLWVEAVEGTLAPAVADQVRIHTRDCASCREKIAQARKGREWLQVLKQEALVPPSDLVAKILARTTGAADSDTKTADRYSLPGFSFPETDTTPLRDENVVGQVVFEGNRGPVIPVWQRPSVVLLRKTVFDPRMALVAAMAFFSISLTLNLLGVKLTDFRAADLQPQAMRRAVTRQYSQANARVVHYYENLRIVYELEARVHQLRQAADSTPVPEKTNYPQGKQGSGKEDQKHRSDGNDESNRNGVHRERLDVMPVKDQNAQRNRAVPADPVPVFAGPVIDASMNISRGSGLDASDGGQPRWMSTVVTESIGQQGSQAGSHVLQVARFCMTERNSA